MTASGALSGGPIYTLPVRVALQTSSEQITVDISKAGFEFNPPGQYATVYWVSTGYTYAQSVQIGVGNGTGTGSATPAPHYDANGRGRWYVNSSWAGDAQQSSVPTRAQLTAAEWLVVEYNTPPPAGTRFIYSLDWTSSYGHSYATANTLSSTYPERVVVVVADGTQTQLVFHLGAAGNAGAPAKGTQTAATTWSTTSTTHAMTINISPNWTAAARIPTRVYLANSRTGN
jgi:hypothetical protein